MAITVEVVQGTTVVSGTYLGYGLIIALIRTMQQVLDYFCPIIPDLSNTQVYMFCAVYDLDFLWRKRNAHLLIIQLEG